MVIASARPVRASEENRQTQPLCGGTPPGVEGCEPAMSGLDGEYLLALTPTQSPTKPAPFLATVAMDGGAIMLTLMPLDANDRATAIPPALGPYGPFPITAVGTFTAALGTLIIPGKSNPVGDFALTADVVLGGRACAGAMSLCGIARGAITDPLMLALDGTTWGMVPSPTRSRRSSPAPATQPIRFEGHLHST